MPVIGERYHIRGHPKKFNQEVNGAYLGEKSGNGYFQLDNGNFAVASPALHLTVDLNNTVQLFSVSSGVLYQTQRDGPQLSQVDRKNIVNLLNEIGQIA